jgi:hypothetical protein
MAKGHVPDKQTGGTDRGKIREARDDRTAKEAGSDANRVGRDSFAVNTPNRPRQVENKTRYTR